MIYTLKVLFKKTMVGKMNNVQVFDEPIEAKGHLSLWKYNIEKQFRKIEKKFLKFRSFFKILKKLCRTTNTKINTKRKY